jgi:hypothetical protein
VKNGDMSTHRRSARQLKTEILELLGSRDLDHAIDALCQMPARQPISPLLSLLTSIDQEIKWASVSALGAVVANLADQDMEAARIIMRRLMWQLNDESGGIGWGCPETMGEIMACHAGLAREYSEVLVSYVREDANFLEYIPLQRGAVWGIARLAQVDGQRVVTSLPHLMPFLNGPDAPLRGLSLLALGLLEGPEGCPQIERLLGDNSEIELYWDRKLKVVTVMDLAKEALARLKKA